MLTWLLLPNFTQNSSCSLRKLSGTCLAGVGKHAVKLLYEQVFKTCAMASACKRWRAVARGPGAAASGGGAAGDGERDVRFFIVSVAILRECALFVLICGCSVACPVVGEVKRGGVYRLSHWEARGC